MLTKGVLFIALVLSVSAVDAEGGSESPGDSHLEIQCVPLERSGDCGCGLKIVSQACVPPAHQGGGNVHFFSELHQGASLHLAMGGRELALRSLGPVDGSSFWRAEGDSWQDLYEGGGVSLLLSYSPGQSTCPPDKEDGCEYFDVEADVEIRVGPGAVHRYRAVGACGC